MKLLHRLRQRFCRHVFDLRDMHSTKWNMPEDRVVIWPCWKCKKVFTAHCGLDILKNGKPQPRPRP
jgi:hypothetical protein